MKNFQLEISKREKVLRKLDRPPAGPNWVRFIFDDPTRTAKAILRFAQGQPPFTYQPSYRVIKDRIELGINLETALRVVSAKGSPAGRIQNKELVEAFFSYERERNYHSSNPIDFDAEYFRVSRDVIVPVAPVSIIREKGKFVPVFVCGWTNNPLVHFQRRLLMTMYEDAFLSLTDYQNSPAEVLFFPKEQNENGERMREADLWMRGDYELLSKSELDQSVEIFVLAREMARQILLDEISDLRKRSEMEKSTPSGADESDRPGKP